MPTLFQGSSNNCNNNNCQTTTPQAPIIIVIPAQTTTSASCNSNCGQCQSSCQSSCDNACSTNVIPLQQFIGNTNLKISWHEVGLLDGKHADDTLSYFLLFKFFACHDIFRWPRKYCHWLSMCYSLKLLKQRQQMTKFVIENRPTLKHFVTFSNALKRVRTSANNNAIAAQPRRLQATVRALARYIPFS